MSHGVATLAAVYRQLVMVAEENPEACVCLDRALRDIDMAAGIIQGQIELSACDECGCTVEDGECTCSSD